MVYIDEVDKITKKVPQFSSLFIYFYLNLGVFVKPKVHLNVETFCRLRA